ncbi:RfaG Glycosyltransferase [Rhabdaerophilaceae bacterium]
MSETDCADRKPGLRVAVLMKGYPRLSETFIAQELLALEASGFAIDIWSLRHPTDKYLHPMHRQILAPCFYLPEYLHDAPWRVLRAVIKATRQSGFGRMFKVFIRDLARDRTVNRIRRFGQACVLADEISPAIRHLHVHFLHTPGSVARYAAILTGRSFSFSAHAKDIWTIPDWEKHEKIRDAQWGVTCTQDGLSELKRCAGPEASAKLHLVYHGLNLARFPAPPHSDSPAPDGSDPANPVHLISVGRAVEKKGFDDLIKALALLPRALHWRLVHVGSGPLIADLKAMALSLDIADRLEWRGALPQDKVIEAMRAAHLFVLPSKPGSDGDRDGLPNVLMEASTQELVLVSTHFAAVPEFVIDGETGVLVAPGAPDALSAALAKLIGSPQERQRLGMGAHRRLRAEFSFEGGVKRITGLLESAIEMHRRAR